VRIIVTASLRTSTSAAYPSVRRSERSSMNRGLLDIVRPSQPALRSI
jgi:hypothetical protein